MKALGIDLGGTNLKLAIIDRENGIIEQRSVPSQADKGQDIVLGLIAEQVLEITAGHDVIGIGMGLPGMVSKDQTTVSYPPNLKGWKVVNAAGIITQLTKLPCRIENDANIAALGSLYFGEGRRFNDFIMLTLGTGVGGGIIINRELYKGPTGMAGELGHVIINYQGPLSNSVTRGTIEAYLGQRFLSRFAYDLISQHPDNPLYKQFEDNFDALEPIHLSKAAEDGNTLAKEILMKSGQRLGYAIINFTHILDIRKFVISGGVANAGNLLLEPAREIVQKQMMLPFQEGFELVQENLGNDGALLGAASLAFAAFS